MHGLPESSPPPATWSVEALDDRCWPSRWRRIGTLALPYGASGITALREARRRWPPSREGRLLKVVAPDGATWSDFDDYD